MLGDVHDPQAIRLGRVEGALDQVVGRLGPEVAARIRPWTDFAQRVIDGALADSPLGSVLPSRDVAYGIVALYLGIDMLGHLAEDNAAAESLLDLGIRYAPLTGLFMPRGR